MPQKKVTPLKLKIKSLEFEISKEQAKRNSAFLSMFGLREVFELNTEPEKFKLDKVIDRIETDIENGLRVTIQNVEITSL